MPAQTPWVRQAVVFLGSQALSIFGSSLVQYALLWHVTLSTKSGWALTVFILCGFLPGFFAAPFAGVWADRMDRKNLIVLSDGTIALATLALAVAWGAGLDDLWVILIAAAVRSMGQTVQMSAVGAFLPQFVPQDRLTRVNALAGTVQSVSMFASPVLAGLLMTVLPLEAVFYCDVATAALAMALLLLFLKVPPHEKAAAPAAVSYFGDLRLGLSYIRKHAFLVPYFRFNALFFLLIAPAAFLIPLQVARTFGEEIWRLAAVEMVFWLGMTVGGLAVAAWGGLRNRVHSMMLSAFVMGLCSVLMAVLPNFWLYLTPMLVWGLALPFYTTPATVLLQERVEPDYLGRVFSVYAMVNTSMMPLGMVLFGPLAEGLSVEVILLVSGGLLLLQVVGVLFDRRLIHNEIEPRGGLSS
jgi:DHA3 family macrolide efflux protein-like MFS transporter